MDLYATLGVPSSASGEEIRRAYRALAMVWHPDKSKDKSNDGTKFKEISHAFEVLSDVDRRREHDLMQRQSRQSRQSKQSHQQSHQQTQQSQQSHQSMHNMHNMHNIFQAMNLNNFNVHLNSLFRESPKANTVEETIDVGVTLKDVRDGCVKRVEFEEQGKCSACSSRCTVCAGSGLLKMMQIPGTPIMVQLPVGRPCEACDGTGSISDNNEMCGVCEGSRVSYTKHTYDIRIAPNVADGHVERLKDNIVIRIRHAFEPGVSLVDGDIVVRVELTLEEVVCGFDRSVDLSHLPTPLTLKHAGYRDPTEPLSTGGIRVEFDVAYPKSGDPVMSKYKDVFRRVFTGHRL